MRGCVINLVVASVAAELYRLCLVITRISHRHSALLIKLFYYSKRLVFLVRRCLDIKPTVLRSHFKNSTPTPSQDMALSVFTLMFAVDRYALWRIRRILFVSSEIILKNLKEKCIS